MFQGNYFKASGAPLGRMLAGRIFPGTLAGIIGRISGDILEKKKILKESLEEFPEEPLE